MRILWGFLTGELPGGNLFAHDSMGFLRRTKDIVALQCLDQLVKIF